MSTWQFWGIFVVLLGVGWGLDHIHERLREIANLLQDIRDNRK